MNTMNVYTAKALTMRLFEASIVAGHFDSFSDEDLADWTATTIIELLTGDVTAETVELEIDRLEG